MINILWYGNFYIIPHINRRPILPLGPWALELIWGIVWKLPYNNLYLSDPIGKEYKDSFSVKRSLSETSKCKIIHLIRWCNPLVYLSPMHYGNPDMQASRRGHVCTHVLVRVPNFNKWRSTAGGLRCQTVLRPSLLLTVLYNKFVKSKLGPVVQSVVSLTSSLRVISLTVLADSIYNILIFFAEKCE